ncbi:MAG: hypothetical protein ACRD2X_02405 [Vicinamibacteraceae bacterium]
MRKVDQVRSPRQFRGWARSAAIITLVGTATGCWDFTSVEAPDVTRASDLDTPEGAVVKYNGAVGAFAIAFGSFSSGVGAAPSTQIVATGVLADEFTNLSSGSDLVEFDSRQVPDPSLSGGPYSNLHAARVNALIAARALERLAPTPASRIGELYAYVGYVHLFLAESFCSGLTLTEVTAAGPVAYGIPLTTAEMLEQAVIAFDSAAQFSGDSSRVRDLASIGKGHALLNLGDTESAAAAVANVPTSFQFVTSHSAQVQPNAIEAMFTAGAISVSDHEGGIGLDFVSAMDPRVLTATVGPVVVWSGASDAGSSNILASGVEARLIIAEAELQAGRTTRWLEELNALRTAGSRDGQGNWRAGTGGVAGLEPLSDPGVDSERRDLMFRERAFWLFGSGHRLGDLRRLIRQYGRSEDQVFPTGLHHSGRSFGDAVNLTPPQSARSNPNFAGCLDRDA